MVIINDELLRSFADRDCEVCGANDGTVVGHHVFGRGYGGGSRLDHPWAMLACCFKCHSDCQHYRISKAKQVAIIAKREGVSEERVCGWVWEVLRAAKGSVIPCVTTSPR